MSHIAEMLANMNLDVGTADNEDIVTAIACGDTLQAWEMVSLFPGEPQYHRATSLRSALILLGCVEVEE